MFAGAFLLELTALGTRGAKSKYTKKIADVIIAVLFFDVLERWMCGMGGEPDIWRSGL